MVGDEQHGAGAPRHRAARAPRPSRGLSRAAARWFTDGPLARPGARRRYLTVALVFALLCALPGIIAAWPASAQSTSAAEMLSRIKASASIPYSGLASASGNLALPDLPLGNQVTNLLSSTTRVRAWWLSPNRYRVDQQTPDGEYDTYRNGRVTWSWDSSSRSASRSRGAPEFGPFPSGVDVLPGPLARRVLSQAPVSQLTVGGSHRVSGHTTRLLTWRPNDPRSLVGEVRIWADPANGFVYGVEIRAVGGQVRAFSTSFLDVSLDAPPRSRTNFDPGKDPSSFVSDDRGDRSPLFGFADLPKELGGLPLRSPMGTLFGTYGKGASLVALAVFPDGGNGAGAIDTLRNSIDSPGRPPIEGAFGKGSLISTPLLTGLVFADGNQGYVLVGTVTRAQLEAMALDLVKNPPVTLGGVSEGFGLMITTENLTKRYGKLTIVDDLSLDVRAGDRYGFLGPNGSGKSTTVRMLLGLVFPSSGRIELLGRPVPRQVRKSLAQVGAIIEAPAFWPHLSGRRNLQLRDAAGPGGGRRTRDARVAESLERVGMLGVDDRPVKAYSLGMKQRLGLAAALLRKPDLLILDEPTNGLDPQGILEIRSLLRELNEQGTTVFMSSHLLTEIEALCTRVGVISGGKLVVQDDLDVLRTPTGEVFVRTADADQAAGLLGRSVVRREGDGLYVRSDDPAALNAILVGRGVRISELHVQRRSLEDVFLASTRSSVFSVIAVELRLLARKPRTWISLLILIALPVTVAIFLATTQLAPRPGEGPALLSQVLSNGTLFAAAALAVDLIPLLPLSVLVVAGDAIAGEASTGTLRYLLTRPVGRSKLLVAKLISIVAYVLVAVIAVALSGYLAGIILFKSSGSITTVSGGEPLTPSQTALRILLTVLYVGISMLGVAAFAMFLSTLFDNSLGAALGGFAILIASTTLDALDAAGAVQPYLPTHYWLKFVDLFRNPVLWRDIERGLLLQAVYVAVLLGAAWAVFMTKDIKS